MSSKEHTIGEIIARHHGREGPLLPILHDVQEEFGLRRRRAEALSPRVSTCRAPDVHGVVSFYHDYLPSPMRDRWCRSAVPRRASARRRRLITDATLAAGDRVKIATVYCLGLCSAGPAARVGDAMHVRLDEETIVKLVENA